MEEDYSYWKNIRSTFRFGSGLKRVPRDYYLDIIRKYGVDRVVDVGCGMGETYNAIHIETTSYVGLDVTEQFVRQAKKTHGAELIVGQSKDLPFQNGSFDLATARCLLEHLLNPAPTIQEMARVAKKVVVVVWFLPPGRVEALRHDGKGYWENRHAKERILATCDGSGLTLVDESIERGRHKVWVLEKG